MERTALTAFFEEGVPHMARLTGIGEVELVAYKSRNLDTTCFRGSAPLAHLAMISQPDIFDQVTNPKGLQRDLSPKHASEAFEYVHRARNQEYPRAFPEVVLNVRDKRVLKTEDLNGVPIVKLKFSISEMKDGKVAVSRVDANHRLYYSVCDDRRDPLFAEVPFQIH